MIAKGRLNRGDLFAIAGKQYTLSIVWWKDPRSPSLPKLLASRPMSNFTLQINGETKQVEVTDDTPLLWVLRDHLGLVGTKFGCGKGLCGACTVHLNGTAVRSCQLPVGAAAAGQITTIEGLASKKGKLTPLQEAWVEHDVPQCGYCQAGQIMTATALLNTNKKPSDADIDAAMSGNLCRCATYTRIREAIHTAAAK